MDIESIMTDLVGGKEIRLDTISDNENKMRAAVQRLYDTGILVVHHSTTGLPDNSTKLTVRITLVKNTRVEDWMRQAINLALTKAPLTFSRK